MKKWLKYKRWKLSSALTLLIWITAASAQSISTTTGMLYRAAISSAPPQIVYEQQAIVQPEIKRSSNSQVHYKTLTRSMDDGSTEVIVAGHYTELATGLNYIDEYGKLKESIVEPDVNYDGTVSFNKLPTTYTFSTNANMEVVVTAEKANVVTKSAVAGLSYYDRKTGQSRIIGLVKNADVQAYSDGVFYEDAFLGVNADILYKVHKWGVEQDVVIFGSLPDPSDFGFDADSTVFCVLTEVMDVSEDLRYLRRGGISVATPDSSAITVYESRTGKLEKLFDFQESYAFSEETDLQVGGSQSVIGSGSENAVLVKHRMYVYDGRVFLSEEVDVNEISSALDNAFSATKKVALDETIPPSRPLGWEKLASFEGDIKPLEKITKQKHNELAYIPRYNQRFIVDYVNHSGAYTNDLTFESGETYYISDDLIFSGGATLTIEPSTIIKIAKDKKVQISDTANIICKSHLLDPAFITSCFDTNLGEAIEGCVGNPATNHFAYGLYIDSSDELIQGLDIRYGNHAGLYLKNCTSGEVKDNVFYDCGNALRLAMNEKDFIIRNHNFDNCWRGILSESTDMLVYNSTFANMISNDIAVYMAASGNTRTSDVRNCLFVDVVKNVHFTSGASNYSHNAVYNSTNGFIGTDVIVLTNNPLVEGDYGYFYVDPANTNLIDGGTTNADGIGLYHYTTTTDHTKETNSLVDVGFHYPAPVDSDSDGLYDIQEDSDGDGIWDQGVETCWTNSDTDADGMPDGWEYQYNLDPLTDDSSADADDDGLSNGDEYSNGTNPVITDTDGDGLDDKWEVTYGLDPLAGTTNGLAGWWKLNESGSQTSVADSSGNSNAGVLHNASSPWTYPGAMSNALSLDGINDYVQFADDATLKPDHVSISVWIKPEFSSTSTSRWTFFSKEQPGFAGGYILRYPNGRLSFMVCENGGYRDIQIDHSLESNEWYHLVGTYDATNQRIYVNGSEIATTNRSITIRHTGVGPRIGSTCDYTPINLYKGIIDDVRVYNWGLTSNEVYGLYEHGIDPDADGLSNWEEYQYGGNPQTNDTDGDGLLDGDEVLIYGTSPANTDSDGDGSLDGIEVWNGSDPADSTKYLTTISGNILYSGGQTGQIIITDTSGTYTWIITNAQTGSYTVTNLPNLTNHTVSAYMDSNGNSSQDVLEAYGEFTGNPLYLNTASNGIDITLIDPDLDTDWMPDWWEKLYGLDYTEITNQPVGWWPLDEGQGTDVADISGNEFDGELQYTNHGEWSRGVISNGLYSEDSSTVGMFVNVGDYDSLNISNNGFTACIWIKPIEDNAQTYYLIDKLKEPGNTDGYRLSCTTDNQVTFTLASNSVNHSVNSVDTYLETGIWYHVAATYVGNAVKVVINGEVKASSTNAFSGVPTATQDFNICMASPNIDLKGYIDDARVYQSALTTNQLAQLAEAMEDPDEDGLSNYEEYILGCNPLSSDTDGDGLDDKWEVTYGLDPLAGTTNGLAGWWKLNESGSQTSVADSSGNSNAGVLYNASSPWTYPGAMSNALSLDGINDYVQFADDATLKPDHVSISVWIKPEFSSTSTSRWTFFSKETPGTAAGYVLRYPNGKLSFLVCESGGYRDIQIDYTLNSNEWYHLVGTYDATNQRIYVNGSEIATTNRSITIRHTGVDPRIGSTCDPTPKNLYKGIIDDVRVYNWGLPSNEVYGLYEHGADQDSDGLSNWEEYQYGGNPQTNDTDGDGLSDGWEITYFGNLDQSYTNDSDMDGWNNLEEYQAGSDPTDRLSASRLARGIVINELLYNPVEISDANLEWIELFCAGPRPIDLSGFYMEGTLSSDSSTMTLLFSFPTNTTLYPGRSFLIGGSYMTVPRDMTNYFELKNNSHGEKTGGIRLMAPTDQTIDALYYDYPNIYNFPTNGFGPIESPADEPSYARKGETVVRVTRGVDADDATDWIANQNWVPEFSGVWHDTDGDGLGDHEELSGQSNTNGQRTSYLIADSDGDGANDYAELQSGTDPWDTDTDDDGVLDGVEINEVGSNPLADDFNAPTELWSGDGSDYTNTIGVWGDEDGAAYALSAGGSLYYGITLAESGVVAFALEGTQYDNEATDDRFNLQLYVDGIYIGQKELITTFGSVGEVEWMLPYLVAGSHSIQVKWIYSVDNGLLKVNNVSIKEYDGPDSDENGIVDWLDNRDDNFSGLTDVQSSSYVSPVCLEGWSLTFDSLSITSSYLPVSAIHTSPVPQRGVEDNWYADIPLSPSNDTTVTIISDNARTTHSTNIVWSETDLFNSPTNNWVVRRNDGLLLNAWPNGTNKGEVIYYVDTNPTYTSAQNEAWAYYFTNGATYELYSIWSNSGVLYNSDTISVVSVSSSFNGNPAVWVGKNREWNCPLISSNVWVDADSAVNWSQDTTATGTVFSLSLGQPKAYNMIARLSDEEGPIIDAVRIYGVDEVFSTDYGREVFVYDDGSLRVTMGLVIVAEEIPEDLEITVDIIGGGIVFADYFVTNFTTTTLTLDASDDLNEWGVAPITFYVAPDAWGTYCHVMSMSQDGAELGDW